MKLIEAVDVGKEFRQGDSRVFAVDGVDLVIKEGELVVLTGASGSGKTTLMSLLGALDRPSRGSIRFSGEPLESMSENRLASLRLESIGFVFQDFLLVRHLSVFDNVRIPALLTGESDATALAREHLVTVGLEDRLGHLPDQLSRGEMQRVAIARALMNRPRVVFADEPTANLDHRNARVVRDLLYGLHRNGLTVVIATHDREQVKDPSQVLELDKGRFVTE